MRYVVTRNSLVGAKDQCHRIAVLFLLLEILVEVP